MRGGGAKSWITTGWQGTTLTPKALYPLAYTQLLTAFLDASIGILAALTEEPEENPESARKVIKIPLSDGKWLDVGLTSIMAALTAHPDTKDLPRDTMHSVACTMIYRFGKAFIS